MTIKRIALGFLIVFTAACGALIWHSVTVGHSAGAIRLAAEIPSQPPAMPVQPAQTALLPTDAPIELSAISGSEQTVMLGGLMDKIARTDDSSQYKFQAELTSRGAAVRTARLSEFSNLDRKDPKAMAILSPVTSGKTHYSMACESLYVARHGQPFSGLAFPLEKLNWTLAEHNHSQAVFVAELGTVQTVAGQQQMTEPKLRITRTRYSPAAMT